jgi:NitT/TauT family transport system ATP-binding protein
MPEEAPSAPVALGGGPAQSPLEGSVSVQRVSKTFHSRRGPVAALRDVTLNVGAGRFAALVGASGCGKSTLLRVVSGIYPVDDGRVLIGGDPVVGPRHDVGLVFQTPNLLPWRNLERNVLLPLEVGGRSAQGAAERARELLRRVGLLEFRDRLPHELSGGMQQRAGIVRALVHDPDVLLMDEPFGAVDVLTRERLNFEIQALWEQTGKTILFVTHSIQEAVLLADEVFVFTPRPGTISAHVPIDIPRPRTRQTMHSSEFYDLTERIRAHVTE